MPYSGPASAYGIIGKTEAAYFRMVNEHGGINGRKINFISRDDGYSPPKTVEQVRQLVGQRSTSQPARWRSQMGAPQSGQGPSVLLMNTLPRTLRLTLFSPEFFEPRRRPLGTAHRRPDVLVA
jgi:Periplasmic binding protein